MKKLLSLALAFVMILTLAVPAMAAETRTIYLDPQDWDSDGAWFAVYTWKGSTETWTKMVKGDTYYEAAVPGDAEGLIFLRMSASATTPNWDGRWNKSGDESLPADGKNLFTITNPWTETNTGSWSNYTPAGGNGGPNVTGKTESDVNATFDPEIAITDLYFEAEGILYDQATNTYTIPLHEDPNGPILYTEVYSGKNLKYFADAKEVLLKATITMDGTSQTAQLSLAEYVANGGELFTYDAATGMLKGEPSMPYDAKIEYQYSNNNGTNWSDPVTIEAKRVYDITVRDDIENGTVTADKEFAAEGNTVTLTVTPAEGYELELVGYFNADPEVEPNPFFIENNQFVMPGYDVLIYATFVEATKTYTVTLPETFENGAVTIEGDKTSFTERETVTLNVTPVEGYELDKLIVDGNDVTAGVVDGKYSFPMGTADVEVTATFKKITYAIEIGTFEGGSVTADMETAAEGDTVTLTVATTGKYQLKSIAVKDAESKLVEFRETGLTVYKFVMPASKVTVEAVFEEILTTSANITWGSMSFVYTDGENGVEDGEWSCEEGANEIIVENTGDKKFTVLPEYKAEEDYSEIYGMFCNRNGDLLGYEQVEAGDTLYFYLELGGQPDGALDNVKIGTVTIVIDDDYSGFIPI